MGTLRGSDFGSSEARLRYAAHLASVREPSAASRDSHRNPWRSPVRNPPNMRAMHAMVWRSRTVIPKRSSGCSHARSTACSPWVSTARSFVTVSGNFGSSLPSTGLDAITPSRSSGPKSVRTSWRRWITVCFDLPADLHPSKTALCRDLCHLALPDHWRCEPPKPAFRIAIVKALDNGRNELGALDGLTARFAARDQRGELPTSRGSVRGSKLPSNAPPNTLVRYEHCAVAVRRRLGARYAANPFPRALSDSEGSAPSRPFVHSLVS